MSDPVNGTIRGLVDALVARLTTALENLLLTPAEGGAIRAPTLVAAYLPPKRTPGEPQPPCVVVRPSKGSGQDDGARITILLLIETFAEDAAGWQDPINIIQRVMNDLLADHTLGPFCLELPLEWTCFDEQLQPQWIAMITTTWSQPAAEWLGETE